MSLLPSLVHANWHAIDVSRGTSYPTILQLSSFHTEDSPQDEIGQINFTEILFRDEFPYTYEVYAMAGLVYRSNQEITTMGPKPGRFVSLLKQRGTGFESGGWAGLFEPGTPVLIPLAVPSVMTFASASFPQLARFRALGCFVDVADPSLKAVIEVRAYGGPGEWTPWTKVFPESYPQFVGIRSASGIQNVEAIQIRVVSKTEALPLQFAVSYPYSKR